MIRRTWLLYDGERLLTEVFADNAEQARAEAVKNDTVVQCSLAPFEAPYEYRARVARSRAVLVPLRYVDTARGATATGIEDTNQGCGYWEWHNRQ
jgi:hypothetical protein